MGRFGAPCNRGLTSHSEDRNDVFGLGLQADIGRNRLGVDSTYSGSTTRISYDCDSTALSAAAATPVQLALIAGSALPNMNFVQHTFNLNFLIPIS